MHSPCSQELQLPQAADALAAHCQKAKRQKRPSAPKARPPSDAEPRRSGRPRADVSYKEESYFAALATSPGPRAAPRALKSLDAQEVEALRAALADKEEGRQGAKSRGPTDSGKGVRIQVT